jgi:multidrug efflux pump subunit AcrB
LKLKYFYTSNKIPIYLVLISVIVFGIISLFYLDFSLIPEIEYPELIVITHYPHATPEEIKNLVTAPAEQAVLSMGGVQKIDTLSRDGMSVMRVRYRWGQILLGLIAVLFYILFYLTVISLFFSTDFSTIYLFRISKFFFS